MTEDDASTRRTFLAGTAGASLALAGCSGIRERIGAGGGGSGGGNGTGSADAWAFEDLSAWRAHTGTTLEADTGTKVAGTQSARVSGESGSISREFARPIDLSGHDLSFAVRVEKPRPVDVGVFLTDRDGNQTQLVQAVYPTHPEGWVRVSPSIDEANADLSNVSSVLVTLSGSEAKRYWLDELTFPKRSGEGARALFTFDFITRDVYETAFPVMQEYDLTGCVAVPTDRVGNEGRLTEAELVELQEAGWEVASASNEIDSLHGVSPDIQRRRIERGAGMLEDMGLGEARAFAYPRGELDASTLEVIGEYHDLGFLSFRDSEKGLSQRSVPAPYLVNRSQPSTVDAAKNQLDPAAAYGGIYTMFWWVLEDAQGKTSPAEFRAICEHVAGRNDVTTVTPSELLG